MTRSRALTSALAAVSLSIGLAFTASAQTVYDITGTTSQITFSCLGLVVGFTGNNCSFDGTNFTAFPATAGSGPIALASWHAPGDDPWTVTCAGFPCDVGYTTGDGNQTALALTNSTVTINDPGACDAATTIAFDVGYAAGVRNFGGGPGTQGQEQWTADGDLLVPQFDLTDRFHLKGDLYRVSVDGDMSRLTRGAENPTS